MDYKLKSATNKDCDILIKYKLNNIFEYANDLPTNEIERINQYAKSNIPNQINDYKLIIIDNQIAGCVCYYNKDDGILLDEIYIEDKFRNNGIGTSIIDDLALKNSIIYLWVYKSNIEALDLYEKFGFVIVEDTNTRYYMKYDKVQNIMSIMNDIEYGFKDENDFNIINDNEKWDNEFWRFYYLLTPDELLEKKCGVCWDQVELERELFNDYLISVNAYFIYIDNKKELPSHTFLTYKLNDKIYWFEHSWYDYKGIHQYNNIDELLNDVKDKFVESQNELDEDCNIKDCDIYIYKYNKPKDHATCDEFYDYIKTQKLVKEFKGDYYEE